MGDHLALIVDRLLTESTLEAALKSRKQTQFGPVSPLKPESSNLLDPNLNQMGLKIVECRICQEEDFDTNLEVPCSCCGSLKYAHRKCIQRWCNEKGDTNCEICLQQFKPGYTAPQHLFHYGGLPMNFRGNWEISRQENQDSRIITMVPSDNNNIINDIDEYSSTNRSNFCCRTIAIIFMILLVLRHTLPLLISGAEEYSFALLSLLVLRVAGVIFPIFVMARALASFHRRRRQQEAREINNLSDIEESISIRPHIIHLH